MPAAAIVGLAGVAGSIWSAKKQGDAAKDAARAQTQAATDSNKIYWDIFQQGRTDNEPFRQNALTAQSEYMQLLGLSPYGMGTGGGAQVQPSAPGPSAPGSGATGAPYNGSQIGPPVDVRMAQGQFGGGMRPEGWTLDQMDPNAGPGRGIGGLLGTTGTGGPGQVNPPMATTGGGLPPSTDPAAAQSAAFDRFRNTPGYQFGLSEGQGQVQSSAAARGGLYSGATMKALQRYGNDYADQQGFTPYMNRLASLAGMGQTANAQNAQLGMSYAQGAGQNLMAAGNARASGLYNRGQASAGLAQNLTGIAGMLGGMYQNRGGWG